MSIEHCRAQLSVIHSLNSMAFDGRSLLDLITLMRVDKLLLTQCITFFLVSFHCSDMKLNLTSGFLLGLAKNQWYYVWIKGRSALRANTDAGTQRELQMLHDFLASVRLLVSLLDELIQSSHSLRSHHGLVVCLLGLVSLLEDPFRLMNISFYLQFSDHLL